MTSPDTMRAVWDEHGIDLHTESLIGAIIGVAGTGLICGLVALVNWIFPL